MKQKFVSALAVFVGLAVAGLPAFLILRPGLEGTELDQKARTQYGKSKEEVIRALGRPKRTYSPSEYLADHAGLVGSFKPDPPLLVCEEVLTYSEGVRLVLLLVRSGKVVHVYSGMT